MNKAEHIMEKLAYSSKNMKNLYHLNLMQDVNIDNAFNWYYKQDPKRQKRFTVFGENLGNPTNRIFHRPGGPAGNKPTKFTIESMRQRRKYHKRYGETAPVELSLENRDLRRLREKTRGPSWEGKRLHRNGYMYTIATPPRITPRQKRIEELVVKNEKNLYNKGREAVVKAREKASAESSRRIQERLDALKKWRHERAGRLKKIRKLKNIRALKRVGAGVAGATAVGASAYAFNKYKRRKNNE